jgi:hypothetical protein
MKPQMPHGAFEAWWRDDLGLKDRKLVSDLMAASELLEASPDDTPLSELPARTLAILNRGGPMAVLDAAQRLERGERITEATARQIVSPKPKPVVPEVPEVAPEPPLRTREEIQESLASTVGNLAEIYKLLYRRESEQATRAELVDKPSRRYTTTAFCEQAARQARMSALSEVLEPLLDEKEVLDRFEDDLSPEQALRHRELWMLTTPLLQEYMLLEDQGKWFEEHVLPSMEDW